MLHILKNDGRIVSYQLNKVSRSIRLSCQAAELEAYQTTQTITAVLTSLHQWFENKEEVTTEDIRTQIIKSLASVQPQAAIIYESARSLE